MIGLGKALLASLCSSAKVVVQWWGCCLSSSDPTRNAKNQKWAERVFCRCRIEEFDVKSLESGWGTKMVSSYFIKPKKSQIPFPWLKPHSFQRKPRGPLNPSADLTLTNFTFLSQNS